MINSDKCKMDSYVSVAIYVHGLDLDPNHVTRALRVQPTDSARKGDETVQKGGGIYRSKKGVWILRLEAEDGVVGPMIDQLMGKLGDYGSSVALVSGIEDSYIDIHVAASTSQASGGEYQLTLSPLSVEAISRAGLPIQISFSFAIS